MGADLETVFSSLWLSDELSDADEAEAACSEIRRTKLFRAWLESLLRAHSICSVLDLGCGRFCWGRAIQWPETTSYLGVDYSRQIILKNQREFAQPSVHFETLDILGDRLTTAELVIARGVFELLTAGERTSLFLRLQSLNPRFLLLSEGSGGGLLEVPGQKSALSWAESPFQLARPLATIPDSDWRRLHLWPGSALRPVA